jgi:leucyl/phenylalanyl-tRNA--protein transferase
MPEFEFPDPRHATPEGIVAIGGRLDPAILLAAYRAGIFPWPIDDLTEFPITWFCPPQRGVLKFSELKIPRRLARERARSKWIITIDKDCPAVIDACAAIKRSGESGTWIIPEMIDAYCELHRLGYVHSIEVWEGNELIGGLYGVAVDGVFAGESMFHKRQGASKLALLHLIDHLRSRGAEWIDTQTESPLMSMLGGCLIERETYLRLLEETRGRGLKLFD